MDRLSLFLFQSLIGSVIDWDSIGLYQSWQPLQVSIPNRECDWLRPVRMNTERGNRAVSIPNRECDWLRLERIAPSSSISKFLVSIPNRERDWLRRETPLALIGVRAVQVSIPNRERDLLRLVNLGLVLRSGWFQSLIGSVIDWDLKISLAPSIARRLQGRLDLRDWLRPENFACAPSFDPRFVSIPNRERDWLRLLGLLKNLEHCGFNP